MSKEKQIEEMARIIQNGEIARNRGDLDCTEFPTDIVIKVGLQRLAGAKALYNAGYRKQSEGEWIEASNKPYALCGKKCSLCGARISYREYGHGNHKYCHKCGAKMKGGDADA